MKGTQRFNHVLKEIGGSPRTISDRLEDLVKAGIVRREAFAEIPPRVEYSLTRRGKDLEAVFERISAWAVKWKEHVD